MFVLGAVCDRCSGVIGGWTVDGEGQGAWGMWGMWCGGVNGVIKAFGVSPKVWAVRCGPCGMGSAVPVVCCVLWEVLFCGMP